MKTGVGIAVLGLLVFVTGLQIWGGGLTLLALGLALVAMAAVLLAGQGWRGSYHGWLAAGLATAFVVGFTTEFAKDRICDLVAEPGPVWNACSTTVIVGSFWVGLLAGALVVVGGIVMTQRQAGR